jgi:hypothetical protein
MVKDEESVQVGGALKHFVTGNIYGDGLLASRQTPKLEDHPLSAVATAYSLYSQLPSVSGGALPPSAAWRRAMPWWQGAHITWNRHFGAINA